jgi:hypothetical protein
VWHASTLRLHYNLRGFDDLLTPEVLDLFDIEWQRVRRILQVDPNRQYTAQKKTMSAIQNLVYRSQHDVPKFPQDVCAKSRWNSESLIETADTHQLAKAEYLKWALRPRSYYSVGPAAEGLSAVCFQVVWLVSPNTKFVKSSGDTAQGFLRAGILKLDEWKGSGLLPHEKEVFSCGGVEIVDLLKFMPWKVWRDTLQLWAPKESDVDGCINLSDARKPTCGDFSQPDAPLLLILHQLVARRWKYSKDHLEPLTSPMPSSFSYAALVRRAKPYFQCILFLESLFQKGLTRLVHSATTGYYAALLRADKPGELSEKLGAKEYEKRIEKAGPINHDLPSTFDDGAVMSDNEVSDDLAEQIVAPKAKQKTQSESKIVD